MPRSTGEEDNRDTILYTWTETQQSITSTQLLLQLLWFLLATICTVTKDLCSDKAQCGTCGLAWHRKVGFTHSCSPILYDVISLQWPCTIRSQDEPFYQFPCSIFVLAPRGLHFPSPFWFSVTTFHTTWIHNNLAQSSFCTLQTRRGRTFLQNVRIHQQNYKAQCSHFIWQQTFVTSCHYYAMHVGGQKKRWLYSYN
jgi:hypothetical protein